MAVRAKSSALTVVSKAAPPRGESLDQLVCQLCGEPGHHAQECPMLETAVPPSSGEESMQVDLANMRRKVKKPATTPPGYGTNRRLFAQETSLEESPSWAMVSAPGLTEEEVALISKRRERAAKAQSKKKAVQALTGVHADFPSLSHCWSNEVAINLTCSVASRMRVFLWKKMLWQLRVKKAVEQTVGTQGARWKRNPRWLSLLFAKEVAGLWGHFGAMRQKLNNPDVWHLL